MQFHKLCFKMKFHVDTNHVHSEDNTYLALSSEHFYALKYIYATDCPTLTPYLTVLAGDRVPVALIFPSPASACLEKCSLFSVLEMRGPSTARPVVTELGL